MSEKKLNVGQDNLDFFGDDLPRRDVALVEEAYRISGGDKIHHVANLVCAYQLTHDMLVICKTRKAEAQFRKAEARLRTFVGERRLARAG